MKSLSDGPQSTVNIPDYLQHHNALMLASRIRAYWSAKGLYPAVVVEQAQIFDKPLYVIRSDMVGGWPHGKAQN